MFEMNDQVTDTGRFCVFRHAEKDELQGVVGLPLMCCSVVSINELGQLVVGSKARIVDQVHMMCDVKADPDVQVTKDTDGVDVFIKAACAVCQKEILCTWLVCLTLSRS